MEGKHPKLIVVVTFERGYDCELFPTFGAAAEPSEDRAIPTTARALADKHVGVIAWSREANPDIGEYGPTTTLFVSGDVPHMKYAEAKYSAVQQFFALHFPLAGWLIFK